MKEITKDMTIMDALQVDPDIAGILMGKGMHCISCMAAVGESLEEAMYVHGYSPEDTDTIVAQINDYLKNKEAGAAAQEG